MFIREAIVEWDGAVFDSPQSFGVFIEKVIGKKWGDMVRWN